MTAAPLTNDVLDDLAAIGDPSGDEIVEAVARTVAKSLGRGAPSSDRGDRHPLFPELLHELGRDVDDPRLDSGVRTFLLGEGDLDKSFIERELIEHAQRFFEEHGVAIITALFHAALPEAYLGRRGVQALDMTGELVSNWARRIRETGQFLVNVLTPALSLMRAGKTSLSQGESATRSARRVRLIHAAVRWLLIAEHEPELEQLLLTNRGKLRLWDARMIQLGLDGLPSEPLNQEDLLATLTTFTTVTFEALEKLAVPFDDDDRRAYYHLWNVVGWHLGIGDATALGSTTTGREANSWPKNGILPLEVDEMDAICHRLRNRLQSPSDQGRRLAKTLVQELSYPLPRPLQGGPAFVVRYLIGDDHGDHLDIPEGGYTELLIRRSGAMERVARRTRASWLGQVTLFAVSQAITRYALRAFVSQSRWSERGFDIDPNVASRWGIQMGPEASLPPSRA